ncbi:MAG: hypothetical protein WCO23_02485 [bacterium]
MLKRTMTAIAGMFLVVLFLSNTTTVKAADEAAGRSITIIPPSFELYANPGESITQKLRVRNDATEAGKYTVMAEDFKAVGESGSVDLVDDQQATTSFSLSKWVVAEPKSFTLAAGEEKEIPFSINVPKDAEPGGHYCSILIKLGGDTPVESGAVVASRVGSLVLLRVSGNVNEDAVVESFKASKDYYPKSPVDFELRVKNNGNNHIKPVGTIVITNIFGQKVAELPIEGLNVLPDAIRKMNTQWKFTSFLANRYTATLVATYGQQNKSLSATTSFYVFPKFVGIILGVIVLLVIVLLASRKQIKKALHNLTK